MLPTARSASRGARPGLLVLTAGSAACSSGVTPPARWPRPNLAERAGAIALFLARGPGRGLGRREDMTRTEHQRAAHRRGELARDEDGIHPSHEDDDTSEGGTDARITVAAFLV